MPPIKLWRPPSHGAVRVYFDSGEIICIDWLVIGAYPVLTKRIAAYGDPNARVVDCRLHGEDFDGFCGVYYMFHCLNDTNLGFFCILKAAKRPLWCAEP